MEKGRFQRRKEDNPLTDGERILLSRIYKLDRQIEAFYTHHKGESMNKLLPKTDFIKKANELYQLMNDNLIEISLKRTKYTQKLVNLEKK